MPTLVRISSYSDITRLLDFGASGILVPDISSAEQAKEAVRLTKFAPLGERGMTNIGRCVRYGRIPLSEYCARANDEVCLAVQIESREGLERLDEILSVKGIDIVTTGRQDFSQSFGVPGQSSHPSIVDAENAVIRKAVAYGLFPLISAPTPEAMEELRAKGVYLCTICFDTQFIMKQFQELLAGYHARLE
jgi:4-hydroxy-2-oxoheptanedioate aldolase